MPPIDNETAVDATNETTTANEPGNFGEAVGARGETEHPEAETASDVTEATDDAEGGTTDTAEGDAGADADTELSPYEQGQDAYTEGKSRTDNPFEDGTDEFNAWDEGYEDAENGE